METPSFLQKNYKIKKLRNRTEQSSMDFHARSFFGLGHHNRNYSQQIIQDEQGVNEKRQLKKTLNSYQQGLKLKDARIH
jgi:hypothetical protein